MMRCQDRFTWRDIKTARYLLLVLCSFISNLNDEAAPTRWYLSLPTRSACVFHWITLSQAHSYTPSIVYHIFWLYTDVHVLITF